jgi:hypothetical protein
MGLEPVWVLVPRDQDPKAGKSISFSLRTLLLLMVSLGQPGQSPRLKPCVIVVQRARFVGVAIEC